MDLEKKSFIKKVLFIVAIAYLLYNIYQAIVTTIFISHFSLIIHRLPNFIESSQPTLQLGLFLLQEIVGSIGSYLRLIGGIFAVYSAVLFLKKDRRYIDKFGKTLLFESLYFALLIPAGVNHIVGSIISSSTMLNPYTGVSFLLQASLIFPAVFMLSRKLKNPLEHKLVLTWAGIAAPLYVFGLWVKHGLLWVYALLPSGSQQANQINTIGSVNSLLTLLVGAAVITAASLMFRQYKRLNARLIGTALILVGVYFIIYALVSVWVPSYLAFLPLTEFWMITLPILGVAVLFDSEGPNG